MERIRTGSNGRSGRELYTLKAMVNHCFFFQALFCPFLLKGYSRVLHDLLSTPQTTLANSRSAGQTNEAASWTNT